jgi:2-dehydro-3-deoxygalactonokinase
MEALQNGKYFLSCDWGTSNFRLRLIDMGKLSPVASVSSDKGISSVYALWQQSSGNRFNFYRSFLQKYIDDLALQSGFSLNDAPLVISGMASSTIGMKELPYKLMPFNTDGSDLQYETIDKIILISGARTDADVMRGEETQVIGIDEGYVILPGTHSKHVVVNNSRAISVRTFMTGELFQLLAQKSLLAGSIEQTNNFAVLKEFFTKGVRYSQENNFLNSIFSVRTNILLNKLSPEQNYYYLSGLVIGEELKNIDSSRVYIVGSEIMNELYRHAIKTINKDTEIKVVSADKAITHGHHKVLGIAGFL